MSERKRRIDAIGIVVALPCYLSGPWWSVNLQLSDWAELIGGECKAQSAAGAPPPASICNAAIAFEQPAQPED
jgi:hypothetical protein